VPASQAVPVARDPYSGAVGEYGYGYGQTSPPTLTITLLEYLRILVRHRWLIISIVLSAVIFGAVTTLMKTPLSPPTIRLQIDRAADKIVQGGNVRPEANDDDLFMRTQFELLQSRTMAERVASALKLENDLNFFQPRGFSIIGFIEDLFGSGAKPTAQ